MDQPVSCTHREFSVVLRQLPDDISMNLDTLIDGLHIRRSGGAHDLTVQHIIEDSRHARPGCLFVARPGLVHDGRTHIADAVAAGAVAVLSDRKEAAAEHAVMLVCDDVPRTAALLAERFSGNPSAALKLIGVTGTNGKTTTSHIIHPLLNAAERRCGMIGTVQIDDGHTVEDAALTTPPALTLSPLLRRMVDYGCATCVMETSSHALAQQRTAGMRFDIGVFTNISGDHLDYHANMDEYIAAKAMLFAALPHDGYAVVNRDDSASEAMMRATTAEVVTCSMLGRDAACVAEVKHETITHVEAHFAGPWGAFDVQLPLCGRHNVINALQAAAVGYVLGLDETQLQATLSSCTAPPGRLEPVTKPGDPFSVYVDYAHTDDALENVLRALRPLVPQGGSLRVVFGCGGDRDRTKRPRMAEVACRFGDAVIITSDNPRTENPQLIVDEVASGVPADHTHHTTCMVDRRDAIHHAIQSSCEGDVVLIAGKGHETYQIVGSERLDFDDRLVAAEALESLTPQRTA